ncbi:PQQ-dependent sugar dehydrogenase [Bradyrhizobium sp. U87765 SZCCT0131]|uniref:PQQ-dependent sugar dehydrogenase n=1 Tax=unclassified Bradyrhizobium TaxID=2631580 RepID=UPI001BABDE82|nr:MULTISPECIES: PQQ-dependent sugar dehydrogenase [unclassified Bradyrhizobium]MBR1221897.1 PQQ-dependent sugar dehydrogenase [Bradyrhizobium sp. U87765 SZCCT0131]MBR1263905.1 PQQ-dependent sugar dehydrogenase [Bradyrhizobium sp. U87765 SZCCT0134]MBR1302525.1 PQQ-dependent sugar dehydrogenase [Bradyrhizobium sp. U87765 SZCCT0110]MBR1320155.1 PQQ-dependent sugar dehydrogenase [Bradyrhizobium sp. U87765 SZCCT0109]MBR1348732.1 PQQ-dependent sugar dehydrogenase [Bradyrhizobium sp. U87765 SZCCT004
MKTPVLLVTTSLTIATVLTTLAIATSTRGDNSSFDSSAGRLSVETVAGGLVHPWGLAFLPDGRMLVTERAGRMRIVGRDGKLSPPLGAVPEVRASGQGGLLDVATDTAFATNHTIYFCYAERAGSGGRTAVARATLDAGGAAPHLADVKVIFHQEGPLSSGQHYGCRIAQAPDGDLFVTLGEHFVDRDQAQNLSNHLGKLIRIRPDGSVPPDNPFVGRNDARPEIWSYGHRNPQGLAIHPATGALWEIEHGPRGGDEVNIIEKGKNYGWPVIGYGIDYNGARIHESTARAGMEQPIKYWVPSIAPSGMAFYTGAMFPRWQGSLFTGALAGQMLVRLSLDGDQVTGEERLLHNLNERIRDVRQGPDGALWLLTDSQAGRLLRVTPAPQ